MFLYQKEILQKRESECTQSSCPQGFTTVGEESFPQSLPEGFQYVHGVRYTINAASMIGTSPVSCESEGRVKRETHSRWCSAVVGRHR